MALDFWKGFGERMAGRMGAAAAFGHLHVLLIWAAEQHHQLGVARADKVEQTFATPKRCLTDSTPLNIMPHDHEDIPG